MFRTPCILASFAFHLSANFALLCAIPITGSQDGDMALICAARNGRADCLRLLIDAGADKNARDNVRVGGLLRRDKKSFYF